MQRAFETGRIQEECHNSPQVSFDDRRHHSVSLPSNGALDPIVKYQRQSATRDLSLSPRMVSSPKSAIFKFNVRPRSNTDESICKNQENQDHKTPMQCIRPCLFISKSYPYCFTTDESAHHFKYSDFKNVYKIESRVGKGNFGKVYIASNRSNTDLMVAIKSVRAKTPEKMKDLMREYLLLKMSKHQNVVQTIEAYIYGDTISIIMEYCNHGNLLEVILRNPQESHIAYIFQQILQGVAHLHSLNVIHRDLKCANILITAAGTVKIADFGIAALLKKDETMFNNSVVGSCYWMAPELIINSSCTIKCDIYSIGSIGYEICGNSPYQCYSAVKALFNKARYGPPPFVSSFDPSPEFLKFISKCMNPDPDDRPDALTCLKDPFVSKSCSSQEFCELVNELNFTKAMNELSF